MARHIHILGLQHTIVDEDHLVCAFTSKVLLFPRVIQPYGWHVTEYSNEGSMSDAAHHVVVLSAARLRSLSRRRSREEPHELDYKNSELREAFQRILIEKLVPRAQPGDIVAHVWGPNMAVYERLPQCHHIELSVGYTASPGLSFRVYESNAWMHWHYGRAGQEDGNGYKWVIPAAFDTNRWVAAESPGDYAVFLGRVTRRKGMNELVEIARRMPDLPIRVYGPGDPTPWTKSAPANLQFCGPVFGAARSEVIRNALCMLMPTVFIEPFGNSGIEAQLCGTPLIGSCYGAFTETIEEGVTGFRCHTRADWVEAIRLSRSLDRKQISEKARKKYSLAEVGRQYDWVFRQLQDLRGRGWYSERSRKFASIVEEEQSSLRRKPRIWLYIPYFGTLPSYFQLYLDSLAMNRDVLSVVFLTDIDLSGYRIPENLIPVRMSIEEVRQRAARLLATEFSLEVDESEIISQPYKLVDFKITFPKLFADIGRQLGIAAEDFVGWGDCDLIFGRLADFLHLDEEYRIIGGFHGHFVAVQNDDEMTSLFKTVPDLAKLLTTNEKVYITDEIAFRKPLLDFLSQSGTKMFYMNRYFCDVVPSCFFGLFRPNHAELSKNFFDVYNPTKNINHLRWEKSGRLRVAYDDGDSWDCAYCHLQKRPMAIEFDQHNYQQHDGYIIGENSFRPMT